MNRFFTVLVCYQNWKNVEERLTINESVAKAIIYYDHSMAKLFLIFSRIISMSAVSL